MRYHGTSHMRGTCSWLMPLATGITDKSHRVDELGEAYCVGPPCGESHLARKAPHLETSTSKRDFSETTTNLGLKPTPSAAARQLSPRPETDPSARRLPVL